MPTKKTTDKKKPAAYLSPLMETLIELFTLALLSKSIDNTKLKAKSKAKPIAKFKEKPKAKPKGQILKRKKPKK